MEAITTYKGHCPQCGVVQIDSKQNCVDVLCWKCSVNDNILIEDILQDIATLVKHNKNASHSIDRLKAYREIVEIINKHKPNMVKSSKIMELFE